MILISKFRRIIARAFFIHTLLASLETMPDPRIFRSVGTLLCLVSLELITLRIEFNKESQDFV